MITERKREVMNMKVRELINELRRANPEAEVKIEHPSISTWNAHSVDLTCSMKEVIIYSVDEITGVYLD